MQEKKRIRWIHILAKGVITLPKKFRDKVGIKDGDVVKGWVEKGHIVLAPPENTESSDVAKKHPGENPNIHDTSNEWVTFEKQEVE